MQDPIEKPKSEQRRLLEIVERHPQQADERQQQKDPHGGLQLYAGALSRLSVVGTI
jgi:hypothetical protein